MKFSDLDFETRTDMFGGICSTVFFDNGFGASIISGGSSYTTGSNEFELAVLKGTKEDCDLTYETPITDDVLGHLSKSDVEETLAKIAAL